MVIRLFVNLADLLRISGQELPCLESPKWNAFLSSMSVQPGDPPREAVYGRRGEEGGRDFQVIRWGNRLGWTVLGKTMDSG